MFANSKDPDDAAHYEPPSSVSSLFVILSLNSLYNTVKILKFGTPQTIAIIVLKIEKFDVYVTLH